MIGTPRRWTNAASAKTPDNPVSLAEATRVWVRIGWLSFGGPAGQIALMHRELVEQRRWMSDTRFLHALSYCMLLPGPEAQQRAIYIGWLMHRTAGGVIAGTLFVLPGVIVIGVLSWLYAAYQQLPAVTAIFFGLKAAVLAVVVEAVLRVGRRALKNRVMIAIAAAAFVALYFFKVPFPLVILSAALIGIAGRHWRSTSFPAPASTAALAQSDYLIDRRMARGELTHTVRSLRRSVVVLAVCLVLWFGPVVGAMLYFGRASVFAQQGDRKSTRLNSSHSQISYAVFCLKKKNFFSSELSSSANIFQVPSSNLLS